MITSSDDGGSTDESGDDLENNRENTLRQLYTLQEQVKKNNKYLKIYLFIFVFSRSKLLVIH